MATSKLLSQLSRRSRRFSPLPSFIISPHIQYRHFTNFISSSSPFPTPSYRQHFLSPSPNSLASLYFLHYRSFSTRGAEYDQFGIDTDLATESELLSIDPSVGPDVVKEVLTGGADSILPIRVVISFLDGFHDLTGLPWWIIISSTTLALRIALFPLLIMQLKKLKKIGDLLHKLPPPFPPPLSGKSYMDQFSLFLKEKRAIGCPSYLWFLAYFSVQFPCFLLWMTTIRRMSLDHHPGFDDGGILWFQNLTESPHGVLGPIFPLLIAIFHFTSIQISFQTTLGKLPGMFGLLAKYYKFYLDILTLPICYLAFCLPQGSLVYWVTNSSFTLAQQICLKHPTTRKMLGLPELPNEPPNRAVLGTPETKLLDPSTKQKKVSVANLTPKELLALSVQLLAKGKKDKAIPLLQLALDKDPEYIRAMIVMGQTLLQESHLAEATEFFERAISKLFLLGHPTEGEEFDLMILASTWAGVACMKQKKNAEGIAHLERVGRMEEPEDSKSKAHYFDGLVLLASALFGEGRKTEALKYLRMAAAYDSKYNTYLKECENEDFISDLTNSRRRDY